MHGGGIYESVMHVHIVLVAKFGFCIASHLQTNMLFQKEIIYILQKNVLEDDGSS